MPRKGILMDEEKVELREDIDCRECMCFLCWHEEGCPVDGNWQQCSMNELLEREF